MVQKDSHLQTYEDYVLDAEAKGYTPWCRQWWEDQQEETDDTRLDPEDLFLSARQLDNKYNQDGDGEHPVYTRADWKHIVANDGTIQGYWHWLAYTLSLQEAFG